MNIQPHSAREDEHAIRHVIQQWLAASKRHDVEAVLALAAPDILFHVPGEQPFGRDVFEAAARANATMQIDGTCETLEVAVMGDLAYARNHLQLQITLPDGTPVHRAGYTLGMYRRNEAGQWQLWRDANLLGLVRQA